MNLVTRNPKKAEVQQNNSLAYVFFFSVLGVIIYASLFIYITHPKGKKKINEKFSQLTDYLLVKDNQRNKYDIRDF